MIRISNIKCPIDGDINSIVAKLTGETEFKIFKKSVDARRKSDVHFVYTIDIESKHEEKLLKKLKNAVKVKEKPYKFPKGTPPEEPIVIAGSGPAGLMCGLMLARNGFKVIILERGKNVDERRKDVEAFWSGGELDTESNVQFGEGGAGTFSDGKLNTGIKDTRIRLVLEEFYRHGAPEEILYNAKPHIGTDNLCKVVKAIRKEIESLGGEVRFCTRFDSFEAENGCLKAVNAVKNGGAKYTIKTKYLVIAAGHSARDTFSMLYKNGLKMESKSFSIGARIEHLQENINKTQYGDFYDKLGAADYKLAVHLKNGRGVYTFCMCPGGVVVASASERGGIATNGMSYFARDGKNANSAVLVNVSSDDFKEGGVLGGMYLQREIEQKAYELSGSYKAPAQRVGDFLKRDTKIAGEAPDPTYRPDVVWCELADVFPDYIVESLREGIIEMDKKLPGFADGNAVLTGPETRSSSPVRILRNSRMESSIKGIYPCGEGAGYAGGITSAAVDGIKTAEAIASACAD